MSDEGQAEEEAYSTDEPNFRDGMLYPFSQFDLMAPDLAGYHYNRTSGVAGWNDLSQSTRSAYKVLNRAAGISVPDREFVLWVLAGYLFLLVPINWGLFRLLGRVEWAWIAVPVIALAGTWTVVRLAQLDIGFARSRTEVALLEAHSDLPRGHLTRYLALYTSLSSRYECSFASDVAAALPLTAGGGMQRRIGDRLSPVVLRRVDKPGERIRLESLAVRSNSTQFLHAEEMHDLRGGFRWSGATDKPQFENDTDIEIRDALFLRRHSDRWQYARVPTIAPRTKISLSFLDTSDPRSIVKRQWPLPSEAEASALATDSLQLDEILRMAASPRRIHVGDVRLIGWADQILPGLQVRPGASQERGRTAVVVNLQYGPLPTPLSDENSPAEFRSQTKTSP